MTTTPPEPTITLTGSDDAALAAVQQYARKLQALGAPDPVVTNAQTLAQNWVEWRDANPTLVKVPQS